MPNDGERPGDGEPPRDAETPSDDAVVDAAADAARDVVFSRIDRSAIEDVDVSISFEDGVLDVDVYVNAPASSANVEQVVEDAALAARAAVDDLLE